MINHDLTDVERAVRYDSSQELYVADFDWSGEDTPSVAVIETMAEVAGCDTTALGPLNDTVDPDALDSVLTSRQSVTVELAHEHFEITANSDGRVTVRPSYQQRPSANYGIGR